MLFIGLGIAILGIFIASVNKNPVGYLADGVLDFAG